jgi:hypothetical protein
MTQFSAFLAVPIIKGLRADLILLRHPLFVTHLSNTLLSFRILLVINS